MQESRPSRRRRDRPRRMGKRTTRVSRPKTGKEVEAAGACGHDDISGVMKTHVTTTQIKLSAVQKTVQPNDVRRLLPRGRTRRATGTAHVHPHARRATGATGALSEARPTAKTTVCHASGTTTRRVMRERARSSPMRGPDLAQLSRRRTPHTRRVARRLERVRRNAPRPGATRYGHHARLCCAFECTHGAYVHMAEN